ncbi:vitamin K epoxide reductase family protein [Candidatus Saccharibacteria bacterium]|nr:vitamin K epoxide reductase family protein [Candidatus Saccharibacteria bacterium]
MFSKIRSFLTQKDQHRRRNVWIFSTLLVGSAVGLLASFVLSIEAIELAKNPDVALSCSVSLVLNCATVAKDASAELLGFPNSFIGMITLPVMVTIAVAGLAGVKFPRWFMQAALAGAFLGAIFAGWMFYMSYYVIGVFCPWCLLTDAAMLVIFFALFRYNALEGNLCVNNKLSKSIKRFVEKDYDILTLVSVVFIVTAMIIVKYGDSFFG